MTKAPGLSWSGRNANWRAPRRYVQAGYTPKNVKLEPGHKNDEHQSKREDICRRLTAEMHEWWNSRDRSDTWGDLVNRYRDDEFSPIHEVKPNTREGYEYLLDKITAHIGDLSVSGLGYVEIKRLQASLRAQGASDSLVARFFTMLRTVAKYSAFALDLDDARKAVEALGVIKVRSAAQRSVTASYDQVMAIVAASDHAGNLPFSAGILLQYEFALRAVDVRGQWVEGEGEIYRDGKRWQDGLTWGMFDKDVTRFTKTISKTARTMPEPYTFDLTAVPALRDRLKELRPLFPRGPVIVSEKTGLPFTRQGWAVAFKRYRRAAGVPDEVKCMDLRASGITEAQSLGVDPMTLRDAAQHTKLETTSLYVRDRSSGANKVVSLRAASRK